MDVATLQAAKNDAKRRYSKGLRPGSRWVAWGDSLTAGVNNARFMDTAQLLSLGQLRLLYNAGIGGQRSDEILARFATDVAPYAPNVVTILAGTNDVGQGVSVATATSNIAKMADLCLGIGAVPVLCTVPPSTDVPTGRKQNNIILNAWIRFYAESHGLPLVDFYALLVDPATSGYLTVYQYDSIHPNQAGFAAMGKLVSDTLAPVLPPYRTLLARDAIDANNLVKNALFLTDSNTDGRADNVSTYGAGGTYTLETADSTIKGNWQTVAMTSGAGVGLAATLQTGYVPVDGHRYALSGLIKSTGLTSLSMTLQRNGATAVQPVAAYTQPITKGAFYSEYVVPPGSTGLSVNASGNGTGSFSLAQLTLYDLTAMGLT